MLTTTELANDTECTSQLTERYNSTMSMFLSLVPFAIYTNRVLIPLWIIIGVPGAVLSFLVWSSRHMRSSSSVYLCSLAILDGSFLLLVQLPYYLYVHFEVKVVQPGTCHALPSINMWLQYLSPLLTLGFTIERYISICHPFQRDRLCTVRRALLVTGCMTICCLALGLVQVNFYQYGPDGCSEDPRIFNTSTLQSRVYNGWTKTTEVMFFAVAPLSILLFNTLVLLQARRVLEKQVGGHQTKGKSAATTVTLLTVSFYQIGAVLPVTILLFVGIHVYSSNLSVPCGLTEAELHQRLADGRLPSIRLFVVYQAINKIVESLSVSHYAMKFFIYLLTGSMFRRRLMALCSFCLPCLGIGGGVGGTGVGGGADFHLPVHRTSEERRRWRLKQNGGSIGGGGGNGGAVGVDGEEGEETLSRRLLVAALEPAGNGDSRTATSNLCS